MIGAVLALMVATWSATPVRVVDGDTFEARVAVWNAPETGLTVMVRILGIDTPELHGKCEAEKAAAIKAKARLTELVSKGVFLRSVQQDPYGGRVDAQVMLPSGRNVSEIMIEEGWAVPMGTKRTKDWCKK